LRVSVVAGGVLLLSLLAGDSYWSLMRTLLEPAKDYNWSGNSETGRVELWKRGFGYMLEDPVLGSGALNYASKEGRSRWALAQAMEGNGAKWSVAHNAFLTIGVELGFPGLLVFVAMLWVAVRNLKRAANAHGVPPGLRALLEFQLAAIYGYGVASVFISSQYWTFTFVLVALATSGTVAARTAQRAAASAGGPPAGGPAGGGPAHRGPRRAGPIASRGAVPGLSATSR
jgi:O-antigen ligase